MYKVPINSAGKYIEILDTTLRDGAQCEGISFSVNDKLNIVSILDEFGVDYIEAGYPRSNPKEAEFFARAVKLNLKNAVLCAFSGICPPGVSPESDEGMLALISSGVPLITLFAKASRIQTERILGISPEKNLAAISDSVGYLHSRGRRVFFDAEHFFDAYSEDADYALAVIESAAGAGAETVVLCDTNGGTMPEKIAAVTSEAVNRLAKRFPGAGVAIHCHNDAGCAAASSAAAVIAGAVQVQGSIIGIGERCGNADLGVIIPNLILKYGFSCGTLLASLYETAHKTADIANVHLSGRTPYTGGSAFAHKAGTHIDGMLKQPGAFEHIDPATVGNRRRFLVSEVSGRSGLLEKLRGIAPELVGSLSDAGSIINKEENINAGIDPSGKLRENRADILRGSQRDSQRNSRRLAGILDEIKKLEHDGYSFESADASLKLLVSRLLGRFRQHFKLIQYHTIGEFPAPPLGEISEDAPPAAALPSVATVTVEVGGQLETTAARGSGPVNALDVAIRRALTLFYPEIGDMELTDYKVRVLDQDRATAARVRVLIESRDCKYSWITVGVSDDIIEASVIALIDSIEYKLTLTE